MYCITIHAYLHISMCMHVLYVCVHIDLRNTAVYITVNYNISENFSVWGIRVA